MSTKSKVKTVSTSKTTPTGFPIDKQGVPRTYTGENALSSGRKSKTRK